MSRLPKATGCVCVSVRKREEVGGWPDWNRAVCESV